MKGVSRTEFDAVVQSGIFDPEFYLSKYPEVADSGLNPLTHYLNYGRFEGRQASAVFEPSAYKNANRVVGLSGIEPSLHYALIGRKGGLPRSQAESYCWKHRLDYESALMGAGLSPKEFDDILNSDVFDREFYLERYPDVAEANLDPLLHYLIAGRFENRQASVGFNPQWYVDANPGVDFQGIEPFLHYVVSGRAKGLPLRSAAELYCKNHGIDYETALQNTALSQTDFDAVVTSNVFDPEFYLRRYPDVAEASINPLMHYLVAGRFENRLASEMFDPLAYTAANGEVTSSGLDPFLHYVLIGRAGVNQFCELIGLGDEVTLSRRSLIQIAYDEQFFALLGKIENSAIFDSAFYRNSVPSVGSIRPAAHYFIWGSAAYLSPSPQFSMLEYHLLNPHVPSDRAQGLFHYIEFGDTEAKPTQLAAGECPSRETDDLAKDSTSEQAVRAEMMRGSAYLCKYGFSLENENSLKYLDAAIAELATRTLLPKMDQNAPEVSIIIPAYGRISTVLNCLESLSTQLSRFRVEVIIADDASPADSGIEKLAKIPWLRLIRNEENRGTLETCKHAASCAKGRYFVFLHNDTRVAAGWLEQMISTFVTFPNASVVGSKLLFEDGFLETAGGFVGRNGKMCGYGRGDCPWRPEYCYARRVDFCSKASVAVSAKAWSESNGTDFFQAGFCEEAGAALPAQRRRYEVWLQPLSLAIHYAWKSRTKPFEGANLDQVYRRWQEELLDHRLAGKKSAQECDRSEDRRILIVGNSTPRPDRDSESITVLEVIRHFLNMDWHVTFLPRDFRFAGRYTSELQKIGVETLTNPPSIKSLQDVIETRPEFFDVIFAFNVATLWDWYKRLRKAYPMARIVFHKVDHNHLHLQRSDASLSNSFIPTEAEIIKNHEVDLFSKVDCVVVGTEAEKIHIQDRLQLENIIVYPNTTDVQKSASAFQKRKNICLMSNCRNVDAAQYFFEQIWLKAKNQLHRDSKVLIVGPDVSETVRKLVNKGVIVAAADLYQVASTCRIAVAPFRSAGGTEVIARSLAVGLPVVATTIAIDGMGLIPDEHVLVADDPDGFGAAIAKLYNDEALWQGLQNAGYDFVERHCSSKKGLETCQHILEVADETWISRRKGARFWSALTGISLASIDRKQLAQDIDVEASAQFERARTELVHRVEPVLALPLPQPVALRSPMPRVAVLLHAYHVDLVPKIKEYLINIPFPFDLFISVDTDIKRRQIEDIFAGWCYGHVEIRIFENRGRDIAPKIAGFSDVHEHFPYVLHLHTKKSSYANYLEPWLEFLLECLLGSAEMVTSVFGAFERCQNLGIIGPRSFPPIRPFMNWGSNFDLSQSLAHRMNITLDLDGPLDFPAGSMFWARTTALRPLLELKLTFSDFPDEDGQTDGTLAHAIERLYFYSSEAAGFSWVHAGPASNLNPREHLIDIKELSESSDLIYPILLSRSVE